ncbi:hypothetical protein IID10_05395 [candidate division KSB1 bacterium]|nr:hypothetical protein [candidate division KSB1 bacterium]
MQAKVFDLKRPTCLRSVAEVVTLSARLRTLAGSATFWRFPSHVYP